MAANQKLQCIHCLRYYESATALTQHAEAQGVRCKVRERDDYGGYVDDITAKSAAVAGKHDDDTVKYIVNSLIDTNTAVKKVIDSNVALHKANDQAKATYWDTNKPKW
jgi:hypothetical protein